MPITPQKKLSLFFTLFLLSGLGGVTLSIVTALAVMLLEAMIIELFGTVLWVLLIITFCGSCLLLKSMGDIFTACCRLQPPAPFKHRPVSPDTVVLPPNAYELAALTVESQHATAALAAATAESAEGTTVTTPASLQQLRQQMLQQRADLLQLRRAALTSQNSNGWPAPNTTPENCPDAEVEAELARMREEAALQQEERVLKSVRFLREMYVNLLKDTCSSFRFWTCYFPLGLNGVFFVVMAVGPLCIHEKEKNDTHYAAFILVSYVKWTAIYWALSTVLLVLSGWSLTRWERLAEQLATFEAAEDVTVEVEMEVSSTSHQMLLSEEEK